MLELKRKAILFLSLAIVMAILAGLLFSNQVAVLQERMGVMSKTYVAKYDIEPRTPLKLSDFEVKEIPLQYAPESVVLEPKIIQGSVSLLPLKKGDVLAKNMLKPMDGQANSTTSRLVRVMANDKVQFDSVLEPMDRVDIIVSRQVGNQRETILFKRDVLVLTVYQSGDKQNSQLEGIGVEVSIEDAVALTDVLNYSDRIRILKANNTRVK